jgi:hypothetical protein
MTKNDILSLLISEHVTELVARANKTQGIRAEYLACIAGMWADVLHYEAVPNFHESRLNRWYVSGIEASYTTRNTKIK